MRKLAQQLGNRKTFYLLTLGLMLIGPLAFGQKEKREVSDFSQIGYSLPGSMEIIQSDKVSLVLEGDKDDLERIITRVEGKELKIYTKNSSSGLGQVKVYVTVTELEELSVAGSGDVTIKSRLKTDELEIQLSGSGNIQCEDLEANEVDIDLAGSGDILLGGVAENELEINIAGSGDVKAEDLQTKAADVNIAGSGSVKVWATDELESNIVGSGSVYYKGNPLVDAETMGSGKTKPINY
jgi:hypothetical protein